MVAVKSVEQKYTYTPPRNYKKIDNYVSRSAQPTDENFLWLKNQGVTDVISFNISANPKNAHEQIFLKRQGLIFHNLSTFLGKPNEFLTNRFFKIAGDIRNSNGLKKLHIHDLGGGNKTGFYSLLYKTKYNIDTFEHNIEEMEQMGFDKKAFPDLIEYAKTFIKKTI